MTGKSPGFNWHLIQGPGFYIFAAPNMLHASEGE
jgi:hypothetical protein